MGDILRGPVILTTPAHGTPPIARRPRIDVQPAAPVLDHLIEVTVMRPLTRSAVNSIA